MDSRAVLNWHINILKVLGLWPAENSSTLYVIWSIFLTVVLFISYPLFQGLCVYFVETIDDAVAILLLSGTMVTTVMKAFAVRIKKKPFFELLDLMAKYDEKVHFREHEQFIVPKLKQSKQMFIAFCSICYSSWVLIVLQIFFAPPESRIYLSTYFYPGEFLHKPSIYIGGLVYEAVSNFIFIATTQAVDLFGPSLLHVLGGNIEILCQRLQNFGSRENDPKKLKQELVEHCKMYEALTRYKDLIEEVIAPGLLIQFFVSGLVLCTTAFQLTLIDPLNEIPKFGFAVIYACAMLLEVIIPSFFGSLVFYKGEMISTAIYHSNWIAMNGDIKQIMRFLMLRTMKPIQISTVKIFQLNLTTFLKILKTTYSLFAVLNSMQD